MDNGCPKASLSAFRVGIDEHTAFLHETIFAGVIETSGQRPAHEPRLLPLSSGEGWEEFSPYINGVIISSIEAKTCACPTPRITPLSIPPFDTHVINVREGDRKGDEKGHE
jgi:hypothetical protein